MDQVDPFQCADRKLRAAYKHRHLRAAFCNVQHQKSQPAVTTKARAPARLLAGPDVPKCTRCLTAAGSCSVALQPLDLQAIDMFALVLHMTAVP